MTDRTAVRDDAVVGAAPTRLEHDSLGHLTVPADAYFGIHTFRALANFRLDTMDKWGAFGTAEEVLDRVTEYVDRGFDVPIVRFASFDQTAQWERASEMLLPELARRCKERP